MNMREGTIANKGRTKLSSKPPWTQSDLPLTRQLAFLRRNQSLFKRSWSSQGGTNSLPICFLQTFAHGLQSRFEFVICCRYVFPT